MTVNEQLHLDSLDKLCYLFTFGLAKLSFSVLLTGQVGLHFKNMGLWLFNHSFYQYNCVTSTSLSLLIPSLFSFFVLTRFSLAFLSFPQLKRQRKSRSSLQVE